ncbi:MAG: hypothetical protein H6710_00485 [Myxococcales bacterium]|nr:hypothetical protein [Myxococcales bacterium]
MGVGEERRLDHLLDPLVLAAGEDLGRRPPAAWSVVEGGPWALRWRSSGVIGLGLASRIVARPSTRRPARGSGVAAPRPPAGERAAADATIAPSAGSETTTSRAGAGALALALALALAGLLLGDDEAAAAAADPDPDEGEGATPAAAVGPGDEASADAAAQELARRAAAEAQERCDAGDFDAAIGLWSTLLADVPRSPELAPLRVSFLLAIVDAHERAFESDRDPRRLRVAIELLDRYLGELDPSDDENRVAVEARRRALASRPEASGAATSGPASTTPARGARRRRPATSAASPGAGRSPAARWSASASAASR